MENKIKSQVRKQNYIQSIPTFIDAFFDTTPIIQYMITQLDSQIRQLDNLPRNEIASRRAGLAVSMRERHFIVLTYNHVSYIIACTI